MRLVRHVRALGLLGSSGGRPMLRGDRLPGVALAEGGGGDGGEDGRVGSISSGRFPVK